MKERRLALDREAREIEKEEKKITELLLDRLGKKEKVEDGAFTARIELGGTYPSWKTEFEKRLGAKVVAEVIANTPAKKIVVIEAAD